MSNCQHIIIYCVSQMKWDGDGPNNTTILYFLILFSPYACYELMWWCWIWQRFDDKQYEQIINVFLKIERK